MVDQNNPEEVKVTDHLDIELPEDDKECYIVYTDDQGVSHRIKRSEYHKKGL